MMGPKNGNAKHDNADRITSYNVCYTKLLRPILVLLLMSLLPVTAAAGTSYQDELIDQARANHLAERVITSYSIHYTKLYE